MKNITKILLPVAMVTLANIYFAQNVNDIPVYSGIHYYSTEVKKYIQENEAAGIHLDDTIFYEEEVADIFSSPGIQTILPATLKKINEYLVVKKEGMIVVDEYGRKIFISLAALDKDNLVLEGGYVKNNIFYPNVISLLGMAYKEDTTNPGTMIPWLRIIKFLNK